MPLTRDEILALDGPALDAAVATEVMGWKRGTPPHDGMWFDDANCGRWNSHWQPHKRWDHAGEVVEAMRKKGWQIHTRTGDGGTICRIQRLSSLGGLANLRTLGRAHGVTFPLAICRAALLAVSEEETVQ